MGEPLKILSLGAGVQSSCLLLMSIKGQLPRIDHAIFADTQYEPPAVYKWLEFLKAQAAIADIPLTVVTRGDLRADAIEFRSHRETRGVRDGGKCYASIPLFVKNTDSSRGIIRRQCTSEYKIHPIEKFIKRELLGIAPRQRAPRIPVVDQWFGITWDESQRMRDSREKWKRHVYPFCGQFGDNMLPMVWRRRDCLNWIEANYPGAKPVKSACICCPFRNDVSWREMRDNDPESFADAIEFDRQIRIAELDYQARPETKHKLRKKLVGQPYIHSSLKPLGEINFDDPDKDQQNLFENECEGMCGV